MEKNSSVEIVGERARD